ncbi:SDR family oxidoreductase [Sorangium sp. So ce1151]
MARQQVQAPRRSIPSSASARRAPLARSKIRWPVDRRWEPGAGNLHAGLCPGGDPKGSSLPGLGAPGRRRPGATRPHALKDLVRSFMAIKRHGRPEEVAGMVAWLAGPEAGFVTGAMHTIDGAFGA